MYLKPFVTFLNVGSKFAILTDLIDNNYDRLIIIILTSGGIPQTTKRI